MQMIASAHNLRLFQSNEEIRDQALTLIDRLLAGEIDEIIFVGDNIPMLQAGNLRTAGGGMSAIWELNFAGQCGSGIYSGNFSDPDDFKLYFAALVEKKVGMAYRFDRPTVFNLHIRGK